VGKRENRHGQRQRNPEALSEIFDVMRVVIMRLALRRVTMFCLMLAQFVMSMLGVIIVSMMMVFLIFFHS
jgi:hypothetical protein